jgi:hypothetical protein
VTRRPRLRGSSARRGCRAPATRTPPSTARTAGRPPPSPSPSATLNATRKDAHNRSGAGAGAAAPRKEEEDLWLRAYGPRGSRFAGEEEGCLSENPDDYLRKKGSRGRGGGPGIL